MNELAKETNKDATTWGMLAHLSALSGYVIPFGHLIGPFVIWMIKKDTLPFVDEQGKESLNFQISVTIYAIISAVLILAVVGLFMLAAVGIGALVLVIIATVKASNGEHYRYPLTIRLIK